MSDLSEKFTALEDQLDTENSAVLSALAGLSDSLDVLNTAVDTLNNNQSTNTQYLLQALRSLDPCVCAGNPTLIIPPTITDPVTVGSDSCKRIQAFLHTMQEIMTVLDIASTFSVGLNFSLISNSINQVIAGIESGSGLPVISFSEASRLLNDMINYIIANLLRGDSLSSQFSSILLDIRDAMTPGTSASSMQSLYNASIDASSLPDDEKAVMKHAAYDDLFSYYFDPTSSPNLTGYSGTACGIPSGTCYTFDLVTQHDSGGGTYDVVAGDFALFTALLSITVNGGGTLTADIPSYYGGNLAGWTWEVLIGSATIFYRTGAPTANQLFSTTGVQGVDGVPDACPSPTGTWFIRGATGGRVRLCAP